MKILVTGAAGFIGAALSLRLLEQGHVVIGVDSLNDYYATALKRQRLSRLEIFSNFSFHRLDLSEPNALMGLPDQIGIDRIIHLAAQAGVRHSIENPYPFIASNIVGHLSVLEFCRALPEAPLLIYASSSSVYGQGAKTPFRESGAYGEAASLYAVTKQTDEAMSQTYASLYGLRQIGLRFFSVYGPWGRPDMAYWMFTRNILQGAPVTVFNHGNMARDFTYIDDAVSGVMAVIFGRPDFSNDKPPHQIFNIGRGKSERLSALVAAIMDAAGEQTPIEYLPMHAGDVVETHADITAIQTAFNYAPKYDLARGIDEFVAWFKSDPRYERY